MLGVAVGPLPSGGASSEPGPWINGPRDPAGLVNLAVAPGEFVEALVYGGHGQAIGSAVYRITQRYQSTQMGWFAEGQFMGSNSAEARTALGAALSAQPPAALQAV